MDDISILDVGAALAGVAALATLIAGLYQYVLQNRQQLLSEIIGGSKESAAVAASKVRAGRMPRSRRQQEEILRALCLATVFESSGRSRAFIYDALASQIQGKDRQLITSMVDDLTVAVARSDAYTDVAGANRRMQALRAALALDGDRRTRLSAMELFTADAESSSVSPCHCNHDAHRWTHLREPVAQLGGLVLVCKDVEVAGTKGVRSRDVPVISLDYHRVRRSGPGLSLSPRGAAVVKAKYGTNSSSIEPGATDLSRALANVVRANPVFNSAGRVAAVPGTDHPLSDALGKQVSDLVGKVLVVIRTEPGWATHERPRYRVDEELSGSVILIDDVYRSGKTFARATDALFDAGASEVLGLTATCTLTSSVVPCGLDDSDHA